MKNQETKIERAVFAGGCFWCMVVPFEKMPGVEKVVSGYMGGEGENPTYEDYAEKGHIEAIEITFDPEKISFKKLLEVFWKQIDPTDGGGQFSDRGPQYRSVIFYTNDTQKKISEKSRKELDGSGKFEKSIATEIIPASKFYPAEDYHQDYHSKNPVRYGLYRSSSGRDQRLGEIWKKDVE